jgi:hypothetical protein
MFQAFDVAEERALDEMSVFAWALDTSVYFDASLRNNTHNQAPCLSNTFRITLDGDFDSRLVIFIDSTLAELGWWNLDVRECLFLKFLDLRSLLPNDVGSYGGRDSDLLVGLRRLLALYLDYDCVEADFHR